MMRIKNLPRWSNQKGQVLVLVALMFLILIAFIGLAVDVGVVFVGYARLRRAVDSAALSAAGQFRKGYTPSDLEMAAEEFLRLNNIEDPHATVTTCITTQTGARNGLLHHPAQFYVDNQYQGGHRFGKCNL
jgi:Flp pilus assembly protein TadG